jgi:serine phosphatase RsbU (regulator of sigma subunit)
MNADGVMFGTERLHKTLSGSMKESAQNICGAVWASLDEFRGEIAQHDDVTLLVIKVE